MTTLYIASYRDLDGNMHRLPAQTNYQLNIAFEHIVNGGDYETGSWAEREIVMDAE